MRRRGTVDRRTPVVLITFPDYDTVADHAVAMMLALLRRIPNGLVNPGWTNA